MGILEFILGGLVREDRIESMSVSSLRAAVKKIHLQQARYPRMRITMRQEEILARHRELVREGRMAPVPRPKGIKADMRKK